MKAGRAIYTSDGKGRQSLNSKLGPNMRTLIAKPSPVELALQRSSKKNHQIEINDTDAHGDIKFHTETSAKKSTERLDNRQNRNPPNFILHSGFKKNSVGTGLFRVPPATQVSSKPIQEEIIVKPLLTASNQKLLRLTDKVRTEFLKVPNQNHHYHTRQSLGAYHQSASHRADDFSSSTTYAS